MTEDIRLDPDKKPALAVVEDGADESHTMHAIFARYRTDAGDCVVDEKNTFQATG